MNDRELSAPRDALIHIRLLLGDEGAASILAGCLTAASYSRAIREAIDDRDAAERITTRAFAILSHIDRELR